MTLPTITSERMPSATVIRMAGELDTLHSAQVAGFLAALVLRPGESLVLEMSAVSFLDSAGLRVLLETQERVEAAGGSLHLVSPQARVLRLMQITGTDAVLTMHADLGLAMAAAARHTSSRSSSHPTPIGLTLPPGYWAALDGADPADG